MNFFRSAKPKRLRRAQRKVVVVGATVVLLVLFALVQQVVVLTDSDYVIAVELQKSPRADAAFTICTSALSVISTTNVAAAISARAVWANQQYDWHGGGMSTRGAFMVTDSMMNRQLKFAQRKGLIRVILQHPLRSLHQIFYATFAHSVHYTPFDVMGPVFPDVCTKMDVFGVGDEEKRYCAGGDLASEDCIVYSLGSNNQWTFEENVIRDTPHCRVFTFDCTVETPRPPRFATFQERVTFQPLCLASTNYTRNNFLYSTFDVLVAVSGGRRPHYLKIDIEGYEFEALAPLFSQLYSRFQLTGVDLFPSQIAIEIHYVTNRFELSEHVLQAFSNYVFHVGGYLIAHRRDNLMGYMATELLLVRAHCLSEWKIE